jgi:hypothetical protein
VQEILVSQHKGVELIRNGKYYMEVLNGEKLSFAFQYPLFFFERLAFWAMPIPAGVIRDTYSPTPVTLLHMPSECSSSA